MPYACQQQAAIVARATHADQLDAIAAGFDDGASVASKDHQMHEIEASLWPDNAFGCAGQGLPDGLVRQHAEPGAQQLAWGW